MACETSLKPNQTLSERKDEVRKALLKFTEGLVSGRIKVKVGPQGAVTFEGITATDRDGITDACAYRRVMAGSNTMAKLAIERAAKSTDSWNDASRPINKQAIAAGYHSHDFGKSWHTHKK